MNRRSTPSSSRSPAGRTAAARASVARAYAARASTARGRSVQQDTSRDTSSRRSTSTTRPPAAHQHHPREQKISSSAAARGKQQGSTASALPGRAGSTTSRSRGQRPNLRVVPRGADPKEYVQSTPKRMKVNVLAAGASPASTVTTLSSKSSTSASASPDARSTKSSGARSSGASTTMRKLVMSGDSKKQKMNIFVAELYNPDHLFELFCNKLDPSEDEKEDFINAAFADKLHDVVGSHTMSENKSAYVKLCSELGVYCDSEKVSSEKKIKAALKELVLSYYAQIKWVRIRVIFLHHEK